MKTKDKSVGIKHQTRIEYLMLKAHGKTAHVCGAEVVLNERKPGGGK